MTPGIGTGHWREALVVRGAGGPRRHPRERARGVAVVARAVAVVAHVVSQHGAPMHCAAYTSEHEVTLLVKYGSAVE